MSHCCAQLELEASLGSLLGSRASLQLHLGFKTHYWDEGDNEQDNDKEDEIISNEQLFKAHLFTLDDVERTTVTQFEEGKQSLKSQDKQANGSINTWM